MQLNLKTPTRFSSPKKKLHTPPSVGHDSERNKQFKLLRKGSFKTLSKYHEKVDLSADSISLSGKNVMKGRKNIPRPLNLTGQLSPPPSSKKSVQSNSEVLRRSATSKNTDLDSPFQIEGQPKCLRSINLTSMLIEEDLNSIGGFDSPLQRNSSLPSSIFDDLNREDGSFRSRTTSRTLSSSGLRRFTGELCSICSENLSTSFVGEKIMELTCGHTCHNECYMILLQPNHDFPQCIDCNKSVKPKDEEMLQIVTSKMAFSLNKLEEEGDANIIKQYIELNPLSLKLKNFTPRDKIIHTADLTVNGFITPLNAIQEEVSFSTASSPSICRSNSMFEDFGSVVDIGSLKDSQVNSSNISPAASVIKNPFFEEKHFDIVFKEDNLIVKALNGDDPSNTEFQETRNTKSKNNSEVTAFVKELLNIKDEKSKLLLFDELSYSTDGDDWEIGYILFLFDKELIIYDTANKLVEGQIPISNVSDVTKLNDNILLVDLKSTSLPEIYLDFAGNYNVLKKWQNSILNIESFDNSNIFQLSSTCLDIIPDNLIMGVQKSGSLFKRQDQSKLQTKLHIIICLNLSAGQCESPLQYMDRVKSTIMDILHNLNDNDQIGLVLVGRDGKGNEGQFGTFIGLIDKSWSGWEEIISNLTPITNKVFDNDQQILNKMMETCYKLDIRVGNVKENINKEIIILSDDNLYSGISLDGFGKSMEKDKEYRINQFKLDTCSEEINTFFKEAHKKIFKNVCITFNEKKLDIGNIQIGEEIIVDPAFYSEYLKSGNRQLFDISWLQACQNGLEEPMSECLEFSM